MTEADHVQSWAEAAESWVRHQDRWSTMTTPLSDALVRAADVRAGMTVLDVACGSGDPAISLALAVGSAGRVIAVDPVAEMLEAARARVAALGLTNVDLRQGGFDSLPLPSASVDRVTSRFGLVYAADAVAAVREMMRVLTPGGRTAIMAWGDRRHNEYWSVEHDALVHLELPLSPQYDQPVEFAYEETGSLAAILREAGLDDVAEEELELTLHWPGPPEELWEEVEDDVADLELPAGALERLRDELQTGYAALVDGATVALRSAVVLASGMLPR